MKNQIVKVQRPGGLNGRRQFLKISGFALASTGILIACKDDDMTSSPMGVFDLGEGDLGVLNYAYALEQLEADFYTKVVNSFYSGISSVEREVLTDLYNHEVNHREFFKTALMAATGGNADLITPKLEFNYGSLDFSNRAQVLGTAKILEDTGVAAYNGAGYLIKNPDYLLIAGKIVSVEARHAAAIRSLLNPDSKDFSGDDVIDMNGLDLAKPPSEILAAVAGTGFVKTAFTANKLP